MLAGESPRDRPTPVVAGEVEPVPAESGGDAKDISAELGHPVRVDPLGARTLAVPALTRRDGVKPGVRQRRQRVVPARPGLWKPVEQQHELTSDRKPGLTIRVRARFMHHGRDARTAVHSQ
jgi:hypothetical protein